jgi:phosphohistidine phosphatase
MRRLYLLRHAKSSWADPSLDDQARPLTTRGRRQARRMGAYLERCAAPPDLALCSSARRTRQTLKRLRGALAPRAGVRIEDRLYGADAATLLRRLQRVPRRRRAVLLVGHNPGISELALMLVGTESERARLAQGLSPGALAILRPRRKRWRKLAPASAELLDVVTPDALA